MATLDVAAGKAAGQMVECHRSEEFLVFFNHIAKGTEPGTEVHVILDDVSSYKSAMINEWLKGRPNWTFHFIPAPASWTNAVEGFLSKLARQRLKHAIFNSLDERFAAIEGYVRGGR